MIPYHHRLRAKYVMFIEKKLSKSGFGISFSLDREEIAFFIISLFMFSLMSTNCSCNVIDISYIQICLHMKRKIITTYSKYVLSMDAAADNNLSCLCIVIGAYQGIGRYARYNSGGVAFTNGIHCDRYGRK